MPAESDADVLAMIQAAIGADERAFDQLVGHYGVRLRWLIQMRLDPAIQARVSPDDVLQEAMLVVHQRIGALEISSEAAFWSWLCKVVEQRISDVRRRHLHAAARDARREWKPRAAADQSTSVRLEKLLTDTVTSPSSRLRNDEQRAALAEALNALPGSYRDVVVLRVLEGLSVSDTAEIMGRSPGAVSVVLNKAIKRLAEVIGSAGLASSFQPRS